MYLISGARLQLRFGLVWMDCNCVLIARVLLDLALSLGLEGATLLPHLGCFSNSMSRFLEPYLFSGSSSSSAAHAGTDSGGSSSPAAKTNKQTKRCFSQVNTSDIKKKTSKMHYAHQRIVIVP